jgi:hypothetical protein
VASVSLSLEPGVAIVTWSSTAESYGWVYFQQTAPTAGSVVDRKDETIGTAHILSYAVTPGSTYNYNVAVCPSWYDGTFNVSVCADRRGGSFTAK